jgi:hypothetical protein
VKNLFLDRAFLHGTQHSHGIILNIFPAARINNTPATRILKISKSRLNIGMSRVGGIKRMPYNILPRR